MCGSGSIAGIATAYGLDGPGIESRWGRDFPHMGVRGQRHAPAAPYPQERPGSHCTGGWVGLRAGLDRCSVFLRKRNIADKRCRGNQNTFYVP
jgi:hypothetical protein